MSNDDRLKNLCGGDKETLERARDLLHIATQKTSQGSGFQLRDPIGLPGACALIASEELKNTIVDFESAKGNACLTKAAFSACLDGVRAALADASKQQETQPNKRQTRFGSGSQLTYEVLRIKYGLPQNYSTRFVEWCKRAEDGYFEMGKRNNMARDSPEIKHAIFYWVCGVLEFDLGSFLRDEPHSNKSRSISNIMDQHCGPTRASILQESRLRSGPMATRTSPRKRPLRELPSKDSPKKRKLSAEPQAAPHKESDPTEEIFVKASTSPRKSPSKHAFRELPTGDSRKKANTPVVTFDSDVEMLPPETPSKTRRGDKAATAAFLSALSTRSTNQPDLRSSPTPASPSKKTVFNVEAMILVPDDDDDNDNERADTSTRRRFRPVFLDRMQWSAQDPYLTQLCKGVEKRTRLNGSSSLRGIKV